MNSGSFSLKEIVYVSMHESEFHILSYVKHKRGYYAFENSDKKLEIILNCEFIGITRKFIKMLKTSGLFFLYLLLLAGTSKKSERLYIIYSKRKSHDAVVRFVITILFILMQ